MGKTLKLEIVIPSGTAYSQEVELVTLPGVEGQFGVYPDHIPLMTQMVPGEIIVRQIDQESYLAVGEGFIEVTADKVAILTDMAIEADKIDAAQAEAARQRAQARLQEKLSAEELAATNAALARSLVQLRVKRRTHT